MLLKKIKKIIQNETEKVCKDYKIKESINFTLAPPPLPIKADLATNVCLLISSFTGVDAHKIANQLILPLKEYSSYFEKVEIAGPGFINFTFKNNILQEELWEIFSKKQNYKEGMKQQKKVLIEYVSANPTGPLHIGHGRGAALGNTLANLMKFMGYQVSQEYYVNNRGRQINLLGESLIKRIKQLHKIEVEFNEDEYKGEYLKEIAKKAIEENLAEKIEKDLSFAIKFSTEEILNRIKQDLKEFGVEFDNWVYEASFYESQKLEKVLSLIKEYIYEKDGALWFKSKEFGDEKDRVIRKKNGEWTYLASDIAYHYDKLTRGYDLLIDIWGADHHGYIPRMKAAITVLGYSPQKLQIILYQLVRLLRGDKQISMSTRSGEFITLREVIEEVGKDPARFFFLIRKADSQLDFDLELAKKQTPENPVYYVQYAHARICSVFEEAKKRNIEITPEKRFLQKLNQPEELDLIKTLIQYPVLLENSVENLLPHLLTQYLQDLAGKFHSYYDKYKFLVDDYELCQARLILISAVKGIIKNTLEILGVSAPQKM